MDTPFDVFQKTDALPFLTFPGFQKITLTFHFHVDRYYPLDAVLSFDARFSGIKNRNFYRKQVPKSPTSKYSERGVDVKSDVKTNLGAVDVRMF